MRSLNLPVTPLLVCTTLLACTGNETADPDEPPVRVGFEIMQIVSPDEIVTWGNGEMSQAEFDAIEPPTGWFKNQPREVDIDGSRFLRSPDGAQDDEFTDAEHFGHRWRHVATIEATDIRLDAEGLLQGSRVRKFHEIRYDAGRKVSVLVSPEGDAYVRVSRDRGRTQETPTVPTSWRIVEYETQAPLDIRLPERVLVIRTNNEDSFQGPATGLDLDLPTPPVELTTELCDDPSLLPVLADALSASDDSGEPSFGQMSQEVASQLLQAPTEGPFYMVNLIRYRARAQYPDGRETTLTGQEADALYAPIEYLAAIGARPVFSGDASALATGDAGGWDSVGIVEYPCPLAFFAMTVHPGFQARSVHKDAGVEATIVMPTDLLPSTLPEDFTPPMSSHPPTADDPAFEAIHVLRYRDQAAYPQGSGEDARSGREAMALYDRGAGEAAERVGAYPTARFAVRGVLIGDGRPWDEVRIDHVPSRAGFAAMRSDPSLVDVEHHRDAALEDSYLFAVQPQVSDVPGAPVNPGTNPGLPPVTADGTGTLCMSDADCPGGGVGTCLRAEGSTGFCTREGCAAGGCQAPYLCCHSCAEAVAAVLPFAGSACFAGDAVQQLSAPPPSCTCD